MGQGNEDNGIAKALADHATKTADEVRAEIPLMIDRLYKQTSELLMHLAGLVKRAIDLGIDVSELFPSRKMFTLACKIAQGSVDMNLVSLMQAHGKDAVLYQLSCLPIQDQSKLFREPVEVAVLDGKEVTKRLIRIEDMSADERRRAIREDVGIVPINRQIAEMKSSLLRHEEPKSEAPRYVKRRDGRRVWYEANGALFKEDIELMARELGLL